MIWLCALLLLRFAACSNDGFDSKVTLIIKTHERPASVHQLVRSIREFYPNVAILVADDGQLSQKFKSSDHVTVLSLPYDVGLSAGRNALLDRVATPYLVLLDDDFVFTKQTTLERLFEVLERNADVDIASGSLYLPGKESEPYSYAELIEVDAGAKELRLRKGNRGALANEAGCFKHDIVLNFFIARTESIRKVRWDARLKLGEHQDFFMRAKQAALVVVACPTYAVALHDQAHSDQNYKAKRMREFQYLRMMLEKHNLRKMRLSTGPIYVDLDR